MIKILVLALVGLAAVAPTTAQPVAAQTVATEETVTFVIDNMKDVTPNEPRTRGEPVEYIEAEPADHSLSNED